MNSPIEKTKIKDLPAWPFYSEDEIQAVNSVLRTGKVNYWTGNEVQGFESEFAEYVGMPYSVALANGSVALELALYALGIGAGDDVIVTPRSFVASASCVVQAGATPIFADIDPHSQNITANTISDVLTPETKAIIVVHLAGWPCEMDEITQLAKEKNLKIIEDCAQAHGAKYKGKSVGSFGDAAAFSFCQDKIMSTGGEGGILLLKEKQIFERAWSYKDHGKNYASIRDKKYSPEFRWVHDSFGTNWRLTEMQAAIGRIQLNKLDDWVKIRIKNAAILNDYFKDNIALRITLPQDYIVHAYYKYYVFLDFSQLKEGTTRTQILELMKKNEIFCSTGTCSEIYREKSFVNSGFSSKCRLPVAAELGETSLVLPVYPTLNEFHMEYIASSVNEIIYTLIK